MPRNIRDDDVFISYEVQCQGVGEGKRHLKPVISAPAAFSIPDWDRPNDIACRGLCYVVAWSSLAESAGRSAL